MSEKHPYVRSVTIYRSDGRRDNAVKHVEMTIFTSYVSDEAHSIRFGMPTPTYGDINIELQQHSKDYGENIPKKADNIVADTETATELAWDELAALGLDDIDEWDQEGV